MIHISILKSYPALILLKMLVSLNLPLAAQTKAGQGALEAVIYPVLDNPFRVFVRFDNPSRRMVSISLRNEKEAILFVDWSTQFKYNLKLDLSELPNGEYRVVVTDRREVIEKTVRISTLYEQKTQRVVSLFEPAGD